ncbi:glycosyltransferase [Flavobacterium psychrophilum]|nr:glycosyltransferase [Flavobacterium psychrophilum]
MSKVKVLFVVGSLCRAGAERFAYEIDTALNKKKIQTTIFCLELENEISHNWKERYYDKKHLELGTPIVLKDKFLDKKKTFIDRLEGYLYRKLKITKPKKPNSDLVAFLNSFDVIHWMGEYTYIQSIPKNIQNKSLIHIMSARFQDDTIYKSFDFSNHYNFCSPFKKEELLYELNLFKDYNHTFIPLVLKMNNLNNQWKFNHEPIKKIGIFTRLDRYKPLDPFLYAFHLLLDKMPNCELHIYGNGDPKTEGIIGIIERLNIKEKVFFRGHQDNIVETVFKENLSLSWFQGYNNDRPAGYAGIDICTTGLPLLCWDFHPKPNNIVNTIYPHFKNLNEFVNYTLEILNDKEKAIVLSENQFKQTKKDRNIDLYIQVLEQEYLRIYNLC